MMRCGFPAPYRARSSGTIASRRKSFVADVCLLVVFVALSVAVGVGTIVSPVVVVPLMYWLSTGAYSFDILSTHQCSRRVGDARFEELLNRRVGRINFRRYVGERECSLVVRIDVDDELSPSYRRGKIRIR